MITSQSVKQDIFIYLLAFARDFVSVEVEDGSNKIFNRFFTLLILL